MSRNLPAISKPTSISDFVEHLELKPDRIAVEHNGCIVPRSKWPEVMIRDGDKLEIVQFVGGGCCQHA